MRACRFEISPCPPAALGRLRQELGVSRALAQVLVRRGMAEPADAHAFLEGSEEHPPQAFAGIGDALATILRHVREGTRITVHGDYDVDGICSTAVLVRVLRALEADVGFYLPDRAKDGYGLNAATVGRLASAGTRLLITADCAITAVEEVAAARAMGLDVVVSDHHAPRADGVLPHAPIVHPLVCGYPCRELCATAVAHKLAQALLEGAARGGGGERAAERARGARAREGLEQDLELVALATIADVVPLRGENRTLARRGLRALAGTAKPGLRALMALGGVEAPRVDERTVAFALAPRLNAAGRLYRADAGLELILTEDAARAQQIARELDAANHERREIEQRIRGEAQAQMRELGERPAYVLAHERWHPGVIGIVASRLVEESGRPVVLLALEGESARGSGRSVEGFDLLQGLSACSEHLVRYGGHRAAAGMELARESVEAFAEALCAHAAHAMAGGELVEVERVDALIAGEELGMELAEELQAMAPYGNANPRVSLMVKGARFTDVRPMGEGRHARFTVEAGGVRARAVAFGSGGRPVLSHAGALPGEGEGEGVLGATFTLEVNEWNGVCEPRLVLRRAQLERSDLAETPTAGALAPLAAAAPQADARAQDADAPRIVGGRGERARPKVGAQELALF